MPKKFEIANIILDKHVLNIFLEAAEKSTTTGLDKKNITDKVLQKLEINRRINQDKWQMKIYRRLKEERDSLLNKGILIERTEEVRRPSDNAKMPKPKSYYILKMDIPARQAMFDILGSEELKKHQFIIDHIINHNSTIFTQAKLRINKFKKYLREGKTFTEIVERMQMQQIPVTFEENKKNVQSSTYMPLEDLKSYLSVSSTFFKYFFCYDEMAHFLMTWVEMGGAKSLKEMIEMFFVNCLFIDQVEGYYIKRK